MRCDLMREGVGMERIGYLGKIWNQVEVCTWGGWLEEQELKSNWDYGNCDKRKSCEKKLIG